MGIEQYNYLYDQAVTASQGITALQELITQIETITTEVEGVSELITSMRTVCEGIQTQIDGLVPLITTEIGKVYDPTVKYNYQCNVCSIKCPDSFTGFRPLDKSILKICKLKGDKSADFKEISSEIIH